MPPWFLVGKGQPLNTGPAPEVPLPAGRAQWTTRPAAPSKRLYGSASHEGPPWVAREKGNEDFAFHTEIAAPDGAAWTIVGVADGASGGTWSKRVAQHAAAAFIETVADFLRDPLCPRSEEQISSQEWRPVCARLFHERIMRRLEDDRRQLIEGRYLDPAWSREHYEKRFLDAPEGFRRTTEEWFQTTLLGAAFGPWGGFAIFLGDGFARVDRWLSGRVERAAVPLQNDTTAPETPIRFLLTEADVAQYGVKGIPSRGATELGILLTTDGVSKSPDEGLQRAVREAGLRPCEGPKVLDELELAADQECQAFLDHLAALPEGLVDGDNMSVAFARVRVGG